MASGDSKIEYFLIILIMLMSIFFINKIIRHKKYQESLKYFIGEGASMEPTILSGAEIVGDPNKKPEIDDIIIFDCEKCKIERNDISILTKRLLKIDNKNCYWVEGDNKSNSYDSRNFGWLCPSDIDFLGVFVPTKE